jgi:hypothetical protein
MLLIGVAAVSALRWVPERAALGFVLRWRLVGSASPF